MKLLLVPIAFMVSTLAPTCVLADDEGSPSTFIQRMMDYGIFLATDIENDSPRLVVGPEFYESDLESKQTAVAIVYQYYVEFDSAYDTLRIIDGSSGAQVGTYTAEGLQL